MTDKMTAESLQATVSRDALAFAESVAVTMLKAIEDGVPWNLVVAALEGAATLSQEHLTAILEKPDVGKRAEAAIRRQTDAASRTSGGERG